MAGTMSTFSPGMAISLVGMGLGASAADKRRNEFAQTTNEWLPNTDVYQQNYFNDMRQYLPQAAQLARDASAAETDQWLAARERAMPGFQKGLQGASQNVFDLINGNVPPSVMNNFIRAGGASTVGMGFGGSGFGALNTGLYGARGSLGAMQTGFGLLPTLMAAMPNLQPTSVSSFLNQGVMNPLQRTNTQLQVRNQNIGIAEHLAGMPTSMDMWGQGLTSLGGQIMGGDASTINTAVGAVAGGAKGMM